ncbi:MAG: HigA family addiction module antidote protein [Thermoleophilia bacterium]|nr:HigA family addiction module antidote protein [Thermoleophilia bacterium]
MATREEIHSDLAIPPGEYLAEVLDDLGMTQADLARRMGRPAQAINEIVRGSKSLTPETALQLERVVGVAAHIWLGLEAEYRLALARQADARQLVQETQLLDAFPYRQMVELACVPPVRRAEDKVQELRRFFGVASLAQLGQVPAYAPAFRVGGGARRPSEYGLAAWLHCGHVLAREVEVVPFHEAALRAALPEIRRLTLAPTERLAATLRSRLAECGVVFALFPHFPKTYAQGATFWITPREKAVVLSSVRGKWADIFWFSLFHELGHLLLHGNATFVEIESQRETRDAAEEEADAFARDALVPADAYTAFVEARDFSDAAIARFATSVEIHPGVLVGRLQHDRLVGHDRGNHLRMRFDIQAGGESGA